MKRIILVYLISISILDATGAWMMSQRSHGELKWNTISTDHFDVHYHQEIRDIALKGLYCRADKADSNRTNGFRYYQG